MDVPTALPRWDLSDLYSSPDSPALREDLDRLRTAIPEFAGRYKGRVAALDGEELHEAIKAYEDIQEIAGRLSSYASLLQVTHLGDSEIGRFWQNTLETLNDLQTELLFFTLEINRIDADALSKALKAPDLAAYRPWLDHVRAFREHQLSDEVEKLFHQKELTGRDAWTRLFDETMADFRFEVEGAEKSLEETLHLLSDRREGTRRAAAEALAAKFDDYKRLFALITNTLAKDKEIEDGWRKFTSPQQARHLANQVEPEVVEALVGAVKDSYADLSHRYYALKARWMGKERLAYWDRNAPLPEDEDREIPWSEAKATVLEAYADFAPEMAEIGEEFFDKGWIDAEPREEKTSGAFAHPTVPTVHPYILLNYLGKTRDVMTLAHELGHGVHQVLAAPQGPLLSDTPLTLAETASVFGEMLTFQRLLREEDDPARRRVMLAAKVEDMLNTVVRQIAFHEFERRLHDARRQGELTPDEIGEIWMATQGESLGPAIDLSAGYENYWLYIPHFVHVPFYVYAYAFGDCLVNSLYAVYEDAPDGFQEKYFDMLRAGGTKRHGELLAPFGLDASDPGFWSKGLGVIAGLIDELESQLPAA